MGQLAAGGSFLGNLMLGIYKGQQAQQEQENLLRVEEMKSELQKLQVEHYKSQTARETKKLELEAQKMGILQNLLPQMAQPTAAGPEQLSGPEMPQATGPVFGPGFENQQPQGTGGNVTGMMARLQAMDPMQLAALKDAGYDVVPGMNANRQEREFTWKQQQEDLKNWMKSQELVLVPQQALDGSIRQVPQFKNPAAAEVFAKKVQELNGGAPMGGGMPQMPAVAQQTPMSSPPRLGGGASSVPKPETRKEVKDGITYAYEVNPYNQQEVSGSRRVEKGIEPVAGETAGRLGMVDSSLDSLYQANAILMPGGELRKDWKQIAFVGNMPSPLNAVNPEAREWNAHMRNALAAKLRMETGANMPKTEEADRDARFLPSALDSEKLAKSKLVNLERFMHGTITMLDPNKQYSKDTYIFKADDGKKYAWEPGSKKDVLPDRAIKSLSEGKLTTFGNGQVWTIEGGRPVRKK